MEAATVLIVLLALVPRAVMATRQTTTIRASITAYSTAVGPSSRFTKSTANRRRASSQGVAPGCPVAPLRGMGAGDRLRPTQIAALMKRRGESRAGGSAGSGKQRLQFAGADRVEEGAADQVKPPGPGRGVHDD